jgi:type IV secretory pathway TrbL component
VALVVEDTVAGAVEGAAAGTVWTTGCETFGATVDPVVLADGVVAGAEVTVGTVVDGRTIGGVTTGDTGAVDVGAAGATGSATDPVSCASSGVAVKASTAAIAVVAGREA